MQSFIIFSPIDLCTRDEAEIILRSFTDFYFNVTNKHRKKMQLVIATAKNDHIDLIKFYIKETSKEAIRIVNPDGNLLNESSVLFMPICHQKSYIPRSLSNGVPILCLNELPQKQFIDKSCGMLVKSISAEYNISQFAAFLQMLYFDPEALKMLQKGAKNRFDAVFQSPREVLSDEAAFSQVA